MKTTMYYGMNYTECSFYCVPQHGRCHRPSRRIHALCAIYHCARRHDKRDTPYLLLNEYDFCLHLRSYVTLSLSVNIITSTRRTMNDTQEKLQKETVVTRLKLVPWNLLRQRKPSRTTGVLAEITTAHPVQHTLQTSTIELAHQVVWKLANVYWQEQKNAL